jgi:hypothetical protein
LEVNRLGGGIYLSHENMTVMDTRYGANVGAERYLELLKNAKVKGYLFEQQNYWSKQSEQ